MQPTEPLYWGLKFYEWLTLAGIVLGPIFAVVITLVNEARRRSREQKIQVMRMLLSTRHFAGDPAYTTAINMIPVEFNRDKTIMKAWSDYIESVRYTPAPENLATHNGVLLARQTTLIYEIMRRLGFKLSESDIQTSAYAAGRIIERDNLHLDAQRAWRDIAAALQRQNQLTEQMIAPQTGDD